MRNSNLWLLVTVATLLWPFAASAQELRGRVIFTETEDPAALASVRLIDAEVNVVAMTLADLDGRFSLDIPESGSYSIHVEHISAFSTVDGPVELDASTVTQVEFRLVARAIELEGIDVTGERRLLGLNRTGFYDRERSSPGFFLTPDQLKNRPPIRVRDIFRTVPGVRFVESNTAGGISYPIMLSTLRSSFRGGICYPRVYLDGFIMELGGRVNAPAQSFDDIVNPDDLIGVEVYRSAAELPSQFGGLNSCGVILLWTRARALR
ncbi:MAG: hypothetical protein ACI9OJ_005374 [Myxococcota bacterium]|jgi:hypothetical protein